MPEPKMKVLLGAFKYPWVPAKYTNASFVAGDYAFMRYVVAEDAFFKPSVILNEYTDP